MSEATINDRIAYLEEKMEKVQKDILEISEKIVSEQIKDEIESKIRILVPLMMISGIIIGMIIKKTLK